MLVYIIDGFNLIHKIPSLKQSAHPHRDLIRYIKSNALGGSPNNKVILVFDGFAKEPLSEEGFTRSAESHACKGVDECFLPQGETPKELNPEKQEATAVRRWSFTIIYAGQRTADEVIKQCVAHAKNKRQIIVVTDDREIRDRVQPQILGIRGSREFAQGKRKKRSGHLDERKLSYSFKRTLTEELKKIWLGE